MQPKTVEKKKKEQTIGARVNLFKTQRKELEASSPDQK